MKIKTISALFLMSSAFLFTQCKKDDTLTPDMSNETSAITADTLRTLQATSTTSTTAYDLTKSLPSGYVKDGSRDYTTYIQKAVSTYSNIVFPAFPLQVNDAGIIIPSNRTLTFLKGSELRLKPTSKTNYMILKIRNVSNVTLNNPVIKGDRTKHLGTSGETGSGIAIYSSNNITVNGANITDCWGDGMYVGKISGPANTNITIRNSYFKSNRRSGITIITVKGLLIDSTYAGYTTEKSPYSGINFEPNSKEDELQNVTVSNVTTEKNKGQGIQMGFSNMYGGSSKSISINVINHVDKGSQIGFKNSISTSKRAGSEYISGTVNLTNCIWNNNSSKPLNLYSQESHLKAVVTNAKVTSYTGTTFLSSSAAKTALTKGISGYKYSMTFNY